MAFCGVIIIVYPSRPVLSRLALSWLFLVSSFFPDSLLVASLISPTISHAATSWLQDLAGETTKAPSHSPFTLAYAASLWLLLHNCPIASATSNTFQRQGPFFSARTLLEEEPPFIGKYCLHPLIFLVQFFLFFFSSFTLPLTISLIYPSGYIYTSYTFQFLSPVDSDPLDL